MLGLCPLASVDRRSQRPQRVRAQGNRRRSPNEPALADSDPGVCRALVGTGRRSKRLHVLLSQRHAGSYPPSRVTAREVEQDWAVSCWPRLKPSSPQQAFASGNSANGSKQNYTVLIMKSVPAKALYRFRLKHNQVARVLAEANLSQNDLARRCGLSSGFMSQLLSGERLAGPKTRRRILAAFPEIGFDELFEEVSS